MFKTKYCQICKGEITIRYHTPDKTFAIRNGQITRDDIHTGMIGMIFDDPILLFECSNDREHDLLNLDEWEEIIREEFYRGAYYEW